MTDTTIVLELTPREAAVILAIVGIVSWTKGSYGKEAESICRALEQIPEELLPDPWAYSAVGIIEPDLIWLDDDVELTICRESV